MAHVVMAHVAMAHVVMVHVVMAYVVMAHVVMAHAVIAYVVIAYVVIAYVVVAHVVIAHVVMAFRFVAVYPDGLFAGNLEPWLPLGVCLSWNGGTLVFFPNMRVLACVRARVCTPACITHFLLPAARRIRAR